MEVINTLATTGANADFRQEVDERLGEFAFFSSSGSSHQQKTPVMNRGLMSAV
ncbi:MAG: hypothetical protein ACYTXA_13335 [Nostoc sp.]